MKIVRMLAEEKKCGADWDCPEVHLLDDGRVLVRGFKRPPGLMNLPDHEDAVILGADVLRDAMKALEG